MEGSKNPSISHFSTSCGNLLDMTDNVIKSTDLKKEDPKPVKKVPAKKAAAKKEEVVEKEQLKTKGLKDGYTLVIFESGASYTSNGIRFTRVDHTQEVLDSDAQILLELENFRLPNQFETENYLNSKED